uniref:Uncharacterized protein n=1 Tax=Trichuris muris TaxID=70415 RepID=A0A5S6QBS2_TRIMR
MDETGAAGKIQTAQLPLAVRISFAQLLQNYSNGRRYCANKKGTWFDGPRRRTSLKTAVLYMYFWCRQMNSIKNCEHELGMCTSAAVNWNHWLRQLTTEAASADAVQIGGEGPDCGSRRDVIFEKKMQSYDNFGVIPFVSVHKWSLGFAECAVYGEALIALSKR